jgi:hypothetical protein
MASEGSSLQGEELSSSGSHFGHWYFGLTVTVELVALLAVTPTQCHR